MQIRSPNPNDKASWLSLWAGYLDFYGASVSDTVTDLTWDRFFDVGEPVYLLVAADEAETLIGFVTYVLRRSTWSAGHYCYLEDLFVDPKGRGGGVARRLINAVADHAREGRCDRLYWNTQSGNDRAKGLYDQLADLTDFVQYRMPLGAD